MNNQPQSGSVMAGSATAARGAEVAQAASAPFSIPAAVPSKETTQKQRAFKVPPDMLSGSMEWVRAHPDEARLFGIAWAESFFSDRVHVCRVAGVPDAFAYLLWSQVRGDVQCFFVARFLLLHRVLCDFAGRMVNRGE